MPPASRRVLAQLKRHGLLLLNDTALPNLCSLVVGERVRGAWWAHPRAQEIFGVYEALEDHRTCSYRSLCPERLRMSTGSSGRTSRPLDARAIPGSSMACHSLRVS